MRRIPAMARARMRAMTRARAITVVSTLALSAMRPGAAGAQESEPLITDRPDQTESAVVVPPGWIQVEVGMTVSREASGDAPGTTVLALPETLLRFGIGGRLELRAGLDGWHTTSGSDGAEGLGDGLLGAKWAIDTGSALQLALLAGVAVPIGDAAITAHRWDPAFLLLLAHPVSDAIGIGYNVGFAAATESGPDGRVTRWGVPYTVSVGVGLLDGVGAFVEGFGTLPLSGAARSEHSVDAGLTLLLSGSLQLDLSGGLGLDADATDWFLGTGVSTRLSPGR